MKLGIIGTGRVAELHAAAIDQIDGATIAGAWNRTSGKASDFCKRFGGVSYSEVDKLLAEPSIEAVLVAAATPTHSEMATRALEAGKHVLLEKPICETSDDIRALIRTAESTGRVCMPSHNYIYAEDVRRLHHHIKSGHLGRIVSFWALFNNWHPPTLSAEDFYMLRELMVHHSYTLLYLMGRPSRISATATNTHFQDPPSNDQLMATAVFDDGAIANLWGSFVVEDRARDPWSMHFKAMGTNGTGVATWDRIKYGPEPEPLWDDAAYRDSFLHVERYFIEQCLGKGAAPLSTLADALDAAILFEAMRTSAEEGRSIEIVYDN